MTRPEDEQPKTPPGSEPETQKLESKTTGSWPSHVARSSVPVFAPEQVLAGRFKIVCFIAEGGMGAVYEAEDLELQERVALKTLRPDIAEDERAIARFKREIRLARKVTHPNVCRIFDVFYHEIPSNEDPAGPADRITFLAMELLPGENLHERLRRAGRMTPDEAFPLVSQMAAALEAAHQAGIIHRDFKSANVMLVSSGPEAEVRVVVTDFGLASHLSASVQPHTSSGTAGIMGTPEYMAPEQVEARDITPAADIYALGIVMYEMLTGAFPFVGNTPLAGLVKRLQESPTSPRIHVPDLEPHWEAAILRCLERNPADRFASAPDVVKALSGEVPTRRTVDRQKNKRPRLLALVSLAAVLLASLSVLGYYFYRSLRHAAAPEISTLPSVQPRPSVAILGFKNLTGRPDAAWLSTALSEMLSTELAAGEKLRLIPSENVARMKIELSLAESDTLAKDTLGRIRTILGAGTVVLGAYYLAPGKESGGQIRLDLRLQDTGAGETLASLQEIGTESQLLDLVSRTGARLRAKLGVGELSPAEAGRMQASRPYNAEAARLYSEGLAKLRLFDALSARDLLEKAVAADAQNPLAHSALAAAWSALGDDDKASEAARKSYERSANLSREERLSVEGRYRETTGEWDKVTEIYRRLFHSFPDNLDYGLRLAESQISAGKGKDALETVDSLRKLPAPGSQDPRVDLAEAKAAAALSDHKRQQSAAAKATFKGTAQGARLLVARARLLEGSVLRNTGQLKKSLVAFEEAKRIYEAAGDQAGAASTLGNIALVLSDLGDNRKARKTQEEALATHRKIGDKGGMTRALDNLASVLSSQGNFAEARRVFEETLASNPQLAPRPGLARPLNNIAKVLKRQGELGKAKEFYERSLVFFRQNGNKNGTAEALHNIGDVLRQRGDLASARKTYEEALALWHELGDKESAGASRLALARLAIDDGRPAEAEATARDAADEFRADQNPGGEAAACVVLARSLLEQQRLPVAQQAIERALALPWRRGNHELRLPVAITGALLRTASGKHAEARRILEATLEEARKIGLVDLQFEARLALGEIEVKSGNAAAGRARLEDLQKEAAEKGFDLIARKAGLRN